MHTYNAKTRDISEFHGDLELQIKTGAISNQEYGFCFKSTGDMWDCMSVRTNLDPERIADTENDPDYETKFELQDGFISKVTGTFTGTTKITKDREANDGQQFNFKPILSKSYKQCTLDDSVTTQPKDGNKIVICDAVNAHWYREFKTFQEDFNLDYNTVPRKEYNVRGFR